MESRAQEELIEQIELTSPTEAATLLGFAKDIGSSFLKSAALRQVAEHNLAYECRYAIVEFLEDPDPIVRVDAIEALAEAKDSHVLLHLTVSALTDRSWLVRGWAAAALGESGEEILMPILDKIVRTDRSAFVRLNGWYALVWLGENTAYSQLLQFLNHPHYRIRLAACNLILNLIDFNKLSKRQIIKTLDLFRELIAREDVYSVHDAMGRCIHTIENLQRKLEPKRSQEKRGCHYGGSKDSAGME